MCWEGPSHNHNCLTIAKSKIRVLLWPRSYYCYSSSPSSFSLLVCIKARQQSSTTPWQHQKLDIHHYVFKSSNLIKKNLVKKIYISQYLVNILQHVKLNPNLVGHGSWHMCELNLGVSFITTLVHVMVIVPHLYMKVVCFVLFCSYEIHQTRML